jgi:hypothetical protein
MDMVCIMRPIDAHATGFFSSGIIERNGFEAAAERLIMAQPPVVRFDRAITKPQRLEFDRNDKIDKHLQWFVWKFGFPRRSWPGPLAGKQTHAVTL